MRGEIQVMKRGDNSSDTRKLRAIYGELQVLAGEF